MEIGIHKMTSADYHADVTAVSNSQLKAFERAPLVYYDQYLMGNRDTEETPALTFGRQFHELILEPEVFQEKYYTDSEIYLKYGQRTRKPYKDAMKEYQKQFEFKECIKHREWLALMGMRDAMRRTVLSNHLTLGEKEITICWRDEKTGLLCKSKIDYTAVWTIADGPRKGEKIPIVLDVKTTGDASHNEFMKSVYKREYKYYRQGAFYLRAVNSAKEQISGGITFRHFGIIAIEKEPPYLHAFYEIPEWSIHAGDKEIDRLFKQLNECRLTNTYPGLPNEKQFTVLEVPDWFIKLHDQEFPDEEMD